MEPVSTMIVSALLAGAAAAAKDTASAAIKDAYDGLKSLIQKKFKGNQAAKVALDQAQKDPKTWEKPLMKAVAENNLNKDEEILDACRKLMELLKKEAPSVMTQFNIQHAERSAIGPNAQYIEHSGEDNDG